MERTPLEEELQRRANKYRHHFNMTERRNKSNVIKHDARDGDEHRRLKTKICLALVAMGIEFYTCVSLEKGGRPDIAVLPFPKLIEIAISETKESIVAKQKKYPCDFAFELVDSDSLADVVIEHCSYLLDQVKVSLCTR